MCVPRSSLVSLKSDALFTVPCQAHCVNTNMMELEACPDDERICCRWGYVIAETEADAVEAGQRTCSLPYVWALRMRDGMIWPGSPGETLIWS